MFGVRSPTGTSDSLSEVAEFWPTLTEEGRVDTSVAFSPDPTRVRDLRFAGIGEG